METRLQNYKKNIPFQTGVKTHDDLSNTFNPVGYPDKTVRGGGGGGGGAVVNKGGGGKEPSLSSASAPDGCSNLN